METSNKLTLCLRQIKRSSIYTRECACVIHPKNNERKWVMKNKPIRSPSRLFFTNCDKVHTSRQHHWYHNTHTKRNFITHHLSSLSHRAKQRPLRSRCIPSQNDTKHFETENSHHKENTNIKPLANNIKGEWQSNKCTEGSAKTHIRSYAK